MYKVIIIATCGVLLNAAPRQHQGTGRIWDAKLHNINQVETWITNRGTFGQTTNQNAGCFWPTGTGQNYIFGAGIWFGTVDSATGDTLVSICYGPHGGECEFAPGLYGQDPAASHVIIYMYPSPWPAPIDSFPMAPQDHVSDQDSWCCFNDCDTTYHVPGDTRPIGLEVYQTVYAWDVAAIHDIIFFTYEVKNVSGRGLYDCHIGVCMDNDLGNEAAANDIYDAIVEQTYIVGTDTVLVDDVAFQWQEEPESGWSSFPGLIGLDMLQTPFDLVPGADKDNDGIPDQFEPDSQYYANNVPPAQWDVDNDGVPDWRDPSQWPQLGATAIKRFTLAVEPNLDNERYQFLAGYPQPYDTVQSPPDDQRFLISSGPFDLAPDSSVQIVYAVMFANWDGLYQEPDTALAFIDEYAELWYEMYWFLYTGVEEHSVKDIYTSFSISPNPVGVNTRALFTMPAGGPVSLKIFDATGRLTQNLISGCMTAGSHQVDIRTHGMSQGMYFVMLETPYEMSTQSLNIVR